MLALDVSNYTSRFTASDLHDVGKVIVGLQDPPKPYPRRQFDKQIPIVLEAGLPVEVYIYLYAGVDFWDQVRTALEKVSTWRGVIQRVWLDMEDLDFTETPQQRIESLRKAVAAAEGWPIGIYTGAWYWHEYMDNTVEFSEYPLWLAVYDDEPSLDDTAIGGWSIADMKQYDGDTVYGNITGVDLNYYEEEEIELVPLDQGRSISEIRTVGERVASLVADQNGDGMYELVSDFKGRKPDKQYIVLEIEP